MISKFLLFRKFNNSFIVLDKLRKDIYFLEKKIYENLQNGNYEDIDDSSGFITNILDYYYTNASELNLKSIRYQNYDSLDKAFSNFSIPISCTIETTNACNLHCAHCYHGSSLNSKTELLSLELIESISDQLYELGTIVVTLTGGEIFLRNDYSEILKYFSKHDFLIQVFSNGILLGKEERDNLDRFGVDLVQISLYGNNEFETEIQLNTNFKRAYKNLIDAQQNSFTTVVVLTPFLNNFSFIQSLVKKLKSENIKYSFNIGLNPGRDFSTKNLKQCIDYNKGYLQKLSYIGDVIKPKKRKSIHTKPCNAGRTIIHIDYKGNISPCISWPEYIGNAKEDLIKNIYTSEKMQNIRLMKVSDINKCRTCRNALNCNICLGSNYLYSGDWRTPNEMLCKHVSILRGL